MSKKFIIAIVVLVMAAIVGKFVMQDNNLLYYSAILAIVAALFIAYVNMQDKTETREKNRMIFEKDRKIRENKEKYKRVSGLFLVSLQSLDNRSLFDTIENRKTLSGRCISGQKEFSDLVSVQNLSDTIKRAEKCEIVEKDFEFDEKEFFREVLTMLQDYAKEYTILLNKLKEYSEMKMVDNSISNSLEKINELYSGKYQNMTNSINKRLEEFNQHLEGMNS